MNAKSVLIIMLLVSLLTACDASLTSQNTSPADISTQPSTTRPSSNLELPPTSAPSVPQSTVEAVRPLPTANPPISPPQVTSRPIVSPPITISRNQIVLNQAFEAMNAISKMDMVSLSTYVHPRMGLRFSPYSFVRDTDLVFTADQVAALPASSQVYHWGSNAGSDAPIDLSFPDYYKDFIYDVDFLNAPEMSLNHRLGGGSTIDNAREFYQASMVVEYYFPGFDSKYQGMDWRGLRLVFTEYNGAWFLVGIIHDEWTP